MKPNKNHIRSLEALIAGAQALAEHGERLLAQMLHGNPSKQLGRKAQTPKEVRVWWNEWADKLGKPKCDKMTVGRTQAFRRRLRAGEWDLKKINARLATLGEFALTGAWFDLDYILGSEMKWTKFIEGKWSVDTVRASVARSRADEVESPHKDKRLVMERHHQEFARVVKKQNQEAKEAPPEATSPG